MSIPIVTTIDRMYNLLRFYKSDKIRKCDLLGYNNPWKIGNQPDLGSNCPNGMRIRWMTPGSSGVVISQKLFAL